MTDPSETTPSTVSPDEGNAVEHQPSNTSPVQSGTSVKLATVWPVNAFKPADADTSFPVITVEGTELTSQQADAARAAAEYSHVELREVE